MRSSVHEFESGLGTIDTAGMHIESGKTRRIEVYGTKGTAIHTPIGSDNLTLFLEEAVEGYAAGAQDVTITRSSTSGSLLRELAACIRGEKQQDYTLAHDRAVQRTLFAGCGITDGDGTQINAAFNKFPSWRKGPMFARLLICVGLLALLLHRAGGVWRGSPVFR